jgi:surface antigen
MPKRNPLLVKLTLGALALVCALEAQAANLGFLNDTPISYMKQRDNDSLKAAAFDALSNKQDGETANWVNEGTGNSVKIDAQITPEDTAKEGERTCRNLRVVLNAKGQSMNLRPQFCRKGGGTWQMQKKN